MVLMSARYASTKLDMGQTNRSQTSILRENLVGANIQTQDSMVDRFEYATDDNEPLLKSHNLAVIIVVPHELPRRRIEELISQGWVDKTDTFLTEWWVEESIFKKRMTSHDNLLSNPFGNMPIKGISCSLLGR